MVVLPQFLEEHLDTQRTGELIILALSAGTYNYTITDTNGCNYNDFVTITEPIILSSTII